jgi:hypothetical protein
MEDFIIKYIDRGSRPKVAADPNFPDGKHVDCGARPACWVDLPYMTKVNVGCWLVECVTCGANCMLTMASRPDDPRSLMLPCARRVR